MDVGLLVSVCGCSLIPSAYFHSEVGIEIGTVYETSVGVCTCECVFVCVYKTDACIALLSLRSV